MLGNYRNKVQKLRTQDTMSKFTCSVNYLLNKNPAYSGWLKKLTDGKFSKSYKRKYAVIHEAIFYFFDDDESSATGDYIHLSRFKVEETQRTEENSKWGLSLVGKRSAGRESETIYITVGCERELKDWLFHLRSWKLESTSDKLYDGDESPDRNADRYVKNNITKKPLPTPGGEVKKKPVPPIPGEGKPLKLPKLPPNKPQPKPKPRVKSMGQFGDYEVGITEGHISATARRIESINLCDSDEPGDHIYAEADEGPGYDDTNDYLPPSVYQWEFDRNSANALLLDLGTPGVYLIRSGKDQSPVLSAFLLGETRHYKIFNENGSLFLRSDQPAFLNLLTLLKYYHLNNLPTVIARLEKPYGN